MSTTFTTPKGTVLPLRSLKGKAYLEVTWRVLWMREEHPDWGIETEFLQLGPQLAIAKATIRDGAGRILAQGTKTETPTGFPDFVEKAETGATGRALALCGYGTQFTQDLDEGERIVDSPQGNNPPTGKPNLQAVKPEEFSEDYGSFAMPFGKYKGTTLAQMGPHGVDTWRRSILSAMEEKGEAPKGQMVQVLAAVDNFLKSRETKKGNQ